MMWKNQSQDASTIPIVAQEGGFKETRWGNYTRVKYMRASKGKTGNQVQTETVINGQQIVINL